MIPSRNDVRELPKVVDLGFLSIAEEASGMTFASHFDSGSRGDFLVQAKAGDRLLSEPDKPPE